MSIEQIGDSDAEMINISVPVGFVIELVKMQSAALIRSINNIAMIANILQHAQDMQLRRLPTSNDYDAAHAILQQIDADIKSVHSTLYMVKYII